MYRESKTCILLTVGILLGSAAAAWAAPAPSAVGKPKIEDWIAAYGEVNGDRNVVLGLGPSRFFLTERTEMRGRVKLDLIGGSVVIELTNVDREVDVWALDNAADTSILYT